MSLGILIIIRVDQSIERFEINIEMGAEVVIERIDIIVAAVHLVIMEIPLAKKDKGMSILVIVIIMVLNHLKEGRLKIRHNQVDTIAQKNLSMLE